MEAIEFADGNGIVYFTNGSELWKTDGTPAGTLFIIGNLSGTQFTTAYIRATLLYQLKPIVEI